MNEIIKDTSKKMQDALDHLGIDLRGIRTGRANPAILDNVLVEVYGAQMRIRDVATITVPESRQILITPFDLNNAGLISKGIERANLNLSPSIDGNCVRITIPPMDDSIRKEMAKVCSRKKEEAKISIRNVRRDANETVRKGDFPEDIIKRMEKEIQELTDKFCKMADDLAHQKEQEVLTI